MSTYFIKHRRRTQFLVILLGMLLMASCSKKGEIQKSKSTVTSKYDDALKDTTLSAASDARHVPPVPGSPEAIAVAPEAAGSYFKAIKLMKEEKFEEALEAFISLEEKFPMLSGPLVNQAIIYFKQEDFEKAEQATDRAIKANGQNPYAHNLRGIIMREKGEFAEARSSYDQALLLDNLYAQAHYNLAVLGELYLQDLPLALDHFTQYQNLQKSPDKTVGNWIKDLTRRVKAMQPPPPAAPATLPTATGTNTDMNTE